VDYHQPTRRETYDSSESGHHHGSGVQVKKVGADRTDCKNKSQHIQPERSMDRRAHILAQPKLQQERSDPDGCDHD